MHIWASVEDQNTESLTGVKELYLSTFYKVPKNQWISPSDLIKT